ncbi:MAG TPA: glycosyltransferase [Anaerolineales bacterium]|nr:glycosyltransferase [Anaerolineales bacterium]
MKSCAALVELGHQVTLWLPAVRPEPGWEELAAHYGIQVRFPIRRLRSLRALRHYDFCLRAVLAGRRSGAELLYVWPYQAAAIGSAWGVPTVLEVHDRPAGRMGPRLFATFLRGRGARRALVTTEALRGWLAAHYGSERIDPLAAISPNGVDLDRYRGLPDPNQARAELGLPDRFTAGYTGHLYAGRGLELMLTLAASMPDVQWLWAGGEPEAVIRWQARLQREGIENLKLLGFVPNERLPLVQAACEVLLMPYERRIAVSSGGDTAATASPMKLFEYLATGRAILASDLPVLREILNETNAQLLPPDEPEVWREALLRLKKYPERRARLGEQARQDAQRYSWTERARRALEGLEIG